MRDAAGPFITYYDLASGERTELSLTSLRNWQSKTANLLIDSYGISAGDRINLRLPIHWLTPVFVTAAAWIGAELVLGEASADITIIGPDQLDQPIDASDVLACSLHPFGLGFQQALPTGIDDYFNDVRLHGDYFAGSTASPVSPELAAAGLRSIEEHALSQGDRILLHQPSADLNGTLLVTVVPELIEGSVVVIQGDSDRRPAIAEQERVTKSLAL